MASRTSVWSSTTRTRRVFTASTGMSKSLQESGLQAGDLIKRIGDSRIETMNDLTRKLKSRAEGEAITVTIRRNDADQELNVKLGKGL